MIGFLRFIGIVNAAIWLGTSIFMTLGIAPAFFSHDMQVLLTEKYYHFYSGQIAHIFFKRYFAFHIFCAVVALLHLAGENLYLGRHTSKFTVGLLLTLLTLALLNGAWLQPKMHELQRVIYQPNVPAATVTAARHSFGLSHGVSQGMNMFIILGILIYVWRVNNPPDITKFVTPSKFGG